MTDNDFDNMQDNNEHEEFSQIKYSAHYKKKERFVRKKRKKVNRLKSFCRFAVFLSVIYLIYRFLLLSGWYLPQNVFKNPNDDRVEILNTQIVPAYVLKNGLKNVPVNHTPIFLMNLKPIKHELYKNPTIKKVYIRRYGFPSRLHIIVKEREPIALIKTDLKSNVVAFYTSDDVLVMNKPYMSLKNYSDILNIITAPKSIKKEMTPTKIKEIEQIVKEVERYSNQKVEYIDLRKPSDVFVKIKTTRIRLGVIDSTVNERIKRLYTILPQITDLNSKVEYVDLSWDKVNYLKLQKE